MPHCKTEVKFDRNSAVEYLLAAAIHQPIIRHSDVAKQKSKSSHTTEPKPKDICFAIMPFGGWFDGYYSSIYQPAILEAGLDPKRADDMYRPSTIVNDIWAYTKQAKIVLADLTGKNANVFYELGLAHALAKPAILIAETMNDVPFDLRALRVIEYDKNEPSWGETLKDKITKSITEVLASPLAAVLPAFLDVKPSDQQPKVSEHDIKMIEMRQEVDLLRRELRSRLERDRGPLIRDEDEAEKMLRRFMDIGMPRGIIIREMIERGAPSSWVERRLDELLPPAPVSRPPAAKRVVPSGATSKRKRPATSPKTTAANKAVNRSRRSRESS